MDHCFDLCVHLFRSINCWFWHVYLQVLRNFCYALKKKYLLKMKFPPNVKD